MWLTNPVVTDCLYFYIVSSIISLHRSCLHTPKLICEVMERLIAACINFSCSRCYALSWEKVIALFSWLRSNALVSMSAFWLSPGESTIVVSRCFVVSETLTILTAIFLVVCVKFPVCEMVHAARLSQRIGVGTFCLNPSSVSNPLMQVICFNTVINDSSSTSHMFSAVTLCTFDP